MTEVHFGDKVEIEYLSSKTGHSVEIEGDVSRTDEGGSIFYLKTDDRRGKIKVNKIGGIVSSKTNKQTTRLGKFKSVEILEREEDVEEKSKSRKSPEESAEEITENAVASANAALQLGPNPTKEDMQTKVRGLKQKGLSGQEIGQRIGPGLMVKGNTEALDLLEEVLTEQFENYG